MIPLKEGAYKVIELDKQYLNNREKDRKNLLLKEFMFCKKKKKQIQEKATKIYEYQKRTGIVKKYYCNLIL